MRPQIKSGFTLVELLVSITILSIMLLSIAQAIGFVSQIWLNGIGTVDNYSKARNILSVMDRDIQQMVMRPDAAAFVDSTVNTPGATCALYTNVQGIPVPGDTGPITRSVSLVQYLLINPTSTANLSTGTAIQKTTLGRMNYGMNYAGGAYTPVVSAYPTLPNLPSLTQLPTPTSANTDTLATGVIQFEYQFVDGQGNILTPPYNYTYTPPGATAAKTIQVPFYYDYTAPNAVSNPRAVIVSLLVLSNSAYHLATQNPTILTQLQTDFDLNLPSGPTPGVPIETYGQYWNGKLNPTTGTLDNTLPAPVRGGLKVFQRYIPLPVVTPTS